MKLSALLALALLFSGSGALGKSFEAKDGLVCATGRVIVSKDVDADVGPAKAKHLGGKLHLLEVPPGQEEKEVARLKVKAKVQFAELDCQAKPTFMPNDPYFAQAWHLAKIGAPQAWDASKGVGVVVAVIDTGVNGSHPDLIGQMVPGWNFWDGNSNANDVWGHGTLVAGTVAAALNNGVGVAGVAGQARIMPLRVTDAAGVGYWSMIAQSLYWAADNGARVANASFENMPLSSSIRTAAQYMKSKGGLVSVAAGNCGCDPGHTPTDTFISVSATNSSDARASFSSYGSYVVLSAPGDLIWTTSKSGGYVQAVGTSFSSPIVAATAALMMSINPGLTSVEVESLLKQTAKDLGAVGYDPYFGHGRVDAAAAVYAAAGTVPPPPPPPPPPPSGDTTPPTVKIGPPNGDTVYNTVTVYASASDNKGKAGITVTLFIGDVMVAQKVGGSAVYYWDTRPTASGPYVITATARDAAGNTATVSKTVTKP